MFIHGDELSDEPRRDLQTAEEPINFTSPDKLTAWLAAHPAPDPDAAFGER